MGHWAEKVLPELKERLGRSGDDHDAELLEYARQAQTHMELLTGHRFNGTTFQVHIEPGGLPFAPTLDARSDALQADVEAWPIPDPIQPEFANVLQISRRKDTPPRAVPRAHALIAAAAVLGDVHRNGRLWLAPRLWFMQQAKTVPAVEFGRRLMDPGRQVHVPVVAGEIPGWWFQVSRRVFFVTRDTPDEPGLVEPLVPERDGLALVAGEPIVIVARITEHPADWVFVARVWIADGPLRPPRAWRTTSGPVHAHGLPIICLDERSTSEEVVAQVLLAAYWHGYLGDDDAAIPRALAAAFPRAVARVRTGTQQPGDSEAAALLFERLVRPGFDPTRGAGSIRHYIARHATTLVRAHRASEAGFGHWREFDINERYYYKLLARFGEKGPDGHYTLDDATDAKMRGYLADQERRRAALDFLRGRGFSDAAARKWLQRHDLGEIATAHPRSPRQTE